ncbi:unnamed protein product [Boreogadus saida]
MMMMMMMMMSESLAKVKPDTIISVCRIVLILPKWELQDIFSVFRSILSLLDAIEDVCGCVLNRQINISMGMSLSLRQLGGQSGQESIS